MFKQLLVGFIFLTLASIPVFCGNGVDSIPDLTKAEWLVLGPFENRPSADLFSSCQGFETDFLLEIGGETAAQPREGLKTGGKVWQLHPGVNYGIDFGRLFPGVNDSVAYAYTEFTSRSEQEVSLKLGSDDGIKVWCNGQLVWSNHIHRAMMFDEDAVPIKLHSGVNRLLIKVDQAGGGWSFVAKLRSLAKEEKDWAAKPTALRVHLFKSAFTSAQEINCMACTVPALGVQKPVQFIAYDSDQQELCRISGITGKLVSLPIPAEYKGLVTIKVANQDRKIQSNGVMAVIGDTSKILQNAIALAHQTSAALPISHGENAEDPKATLEFLANQLEGKVHPSLMIEERQLRAVSTINEICVKVKEGSWKPGQFTGIRQWAYRSKIDDSLQPYTVYLPQNYDPSKEYGLIISLHGYSNDDYNECNNLGSQSPDDFIIVAPYGRGDMGYRSTGEEDVLDVMDLAQKTYPVDPNRVYLTGSSMGGLGVWRIGTSYPDRFAAIAPFCGWTSERYLRNLLNTPILIVHGDQDSTVPIYSEKNAAVKLKEYGYSVIYEELPGVDHDAWRGLVNQKGGNYLFDYFRKFKRNPWPDKVSITTGYVRYGKQYWARLDELVPGRTGKLDANIDDRLIRVKTVDVKAFTLDLNHPGIANQKQVAIKIDKNTLKVKPGKNVTFIKVKQSWKVTDRTLAANIAPRLGGGIADLFMGPVILVYGTGNPERTPVLKRAAEKFAAWEPTDQIPVGSKLGKFRVIADTDVTETDLTQKNILLIGNPEENQVLARLLPKLPVRFTGADDFEFSGEQFTKTGISMVYPNPESPRNLICLMTFPFDKASIDQFFTYANLGLRTYRGIEESAVECMTMPDVLIYNSLSSSASPRSWNFDWLWEQTVELK